MARRLELARLIDRSPSRERDLVMAMIVQRVIAPASKLRDEQDCWSFRRSRTSSQSPGADEDELYRALDWLGEREVRIEDRLARRHLKAGEARAL